MDRSAQRSASRFRTGTSGPVLFLLFVNDLADWIKNNNMRMFADDVKIWNVIRTDVGDDSLQEIAWLDGLVSGF